MLRLSFLCRKNVIAAILPFIVFCVWCFRLKKQYFTYFASEGERGLVFFLNVLVSCSHCFAIIMFFCKSWLRIRFLFFVNRNKPLLLVFVSVYARIGSCVVLFLLCCMFIKQNMFHSCFLCLASFFCFKYHTYLWNLDLQQTWSVSYFYVGITYIWNVTRLWNFH